MDIEYVEMRILQLSAGRPWEKSFALCVRECMMRENDTLVIWNTAVM